MPTKIQTDNNRATSNFNPVLGGNYANGGLGNIGTRGLWWSSEASNSARRYFPGYDGSGLFTGVGGYRYNGYYIRCVSEEKTVLDLTYMQDMTPAIASATPENTTASLTDRRDGKLYNVAKINGNMWMTQNLRFGYDATNPDTSTMQLTPDTSDIALSSERINPTSGQPETDDGFRELTTYDLVSRGKNTSGFNQCRASEITADKIGWGPGFQYACIHSGNIITSADIATVWYNYTLASAGTIIDENTTRENPATNMDPATESICPKGWALPSKAQIDGQRNTNIFSPVLGGHYINGTPVNEATHGVWWGNEAVSGAWRQTLRFIEGVLRTNNFSRGYGFYIRCVQKST